MMAYPHEEGAVQSLFSSRGAQVYWSNWNKMQDWYHSYMMPEIRKFHTQVEEEKKQKKRDKRRRLKKQKRNRKKRESASSASTSGQADGKEVGTSSAESISPEFLEFRQKTLQHRSDLKKAKEEKGEVEEVEYRPDDEGPEERPVPSTAPPSVQAGSERTKELHALYGSRALTIQSLETQLQARFDDNRTKLQPKLWPVIPLNL